MYCDAGDLFGLSPTDLTIEQLNKIQFEKLIDLLPRDERIGSIVADKIPAVKLKSLIALKDTTISKDIIMAYNTRLRIDKSSLDQTYHYDRNYIIKWDLLDDENKIAEITNWSNGLISCVNTDTMDYKWLYGYDEELAKITVDNIVKNQTRSYSSHNILFPLIKGLPKEELNRVFPTIKEKFNKDIFIYILSNPAAKEEWVLAALRIIAKKNTSPEILANITKDILDKLPTITRLEVLENIVRNRNKDCIKNISEDDVKTLVFSSTMKYPKRVEQLVKSINKGVAV